jgi:hypothetical protein
VAGGAAPGARADRGATLAKSAAGSRTFRKAAEVFLDSMLAQFRNPKHRQQWRGTLHT